MKGGAQLREIDLLAGKERRDPRFQIVLAGVRDECGHRVGREALLRPVGEPVIPHKREAGTACVVGIEQRSERPSGKRATMIEQRLPGVGRGRGGHVWRLCWQLLKATALAAELKNRSEVAKRVTALALEQCGEGHAGLCAPA